MTAAVNLEPLARILAGRMLNSIGEGLAVALTAGLLLKVMGRRNSGTRFAVWFSALLTVGATPWLQRVAPSTMAGSMAKSAIMLPSSWAIVIGAVWAVFAGVGLARVGVGLWRLRKLRRDCVVVDPRDLDPMLRRTLEDFQPVRPVALCVSDGLRVPTALGLFDAAVVIPGWAARELSPTQLNSVLIHELAHLRRRDDWTNLAQKVVRALLFFHPAVWWIERRLSLERELACDEVVLANTADPRAYAQCLVSLAEKSFMRRGLALAQAAVDRMRQTSLRVTQILRAPRSGATSVWKPAPYLVTALSVLCLVSVSRTPELVAFENQRPPAALTAEHLTARVTPAAFVGTAALAKAVPPALQAGRGKAPGSHLAKLPVAHRGAASYESAAAQREGTELNPGELIPAKLVPSNQPVDRQLRSVLLVMRSRQYDATGSPVWTILVLHLTVLQPVDVSVANPAKST